MIFIIPHIHESAKAFGKRSLTTVVSELPVDNAVTFFADETIDTVDQKIESRVFCIEDDVLLNHIRNVLGMSQFLETMDDGSFQCDHKTTSVSIISM
ncbi:hypothetical protein D3C81_1997700 [compost metagenome]